MAAPWQQRTLLAVAQATENAINDGTAAPSCLASLESRRVTDENGALTEDKYCTDPGDRRHSSLRRIHRGTLVSHRGCGRFARPLAGLHCAGPRSPQRAHAVLRRDAGRGGRTSDGLVESRLSACTSGRNDRRERSTAGSSHQRLGEPRAAGVQKVVPQPTIPPLSVCSQAPQQRTKSLTERRAKRPEPGIALTPGISVSPCTNVDNITCRRRKRVPDVLVVSSWGDAYDHDQRRVTDGPVPNLSDLKHLG
jgi:hypothetical protein